MCITLFLENNKNILLKRFNYIFLLTYTLNAPKINDLLLIYDKKVNIALWKKKVNIKKKIKEKTKN